MRLWSAAVFTLVFSSFAFGQTYTSTTLAGTLSSPGYSGDNGFATSAQLNYPWGVARDSGGVLYIADTYNSLIRKVANSVITTLAGSGVQGYGGDNGQATAAAAMLNFPSSVAVDPAGANLYIADYFNQRIRKMSLSTGIITTFAGTGASGYSGDNGPAIGAELGGPVAIALDSTRGNLYIADSYNYVVRKVSLSTGVITTVAGNGTAGFSGDGGAAISAQFRTIHGVAVDAAGNLYIADTSNNRVRMVAANGVVNTVAGNGTQADSGDNGPATSAALSSPSGLAVDSAGNLYIADLNNSAVREVANGVIASIAGGGRGFGGSGLVNGIALNSPFGLAVDSAGNVYVADTGNQRILELVPGAPTITSLGTVSPTTGALTVNGTGFQAGAVVQWNGSPLSTAFVSGTQLTATVPPSLQSTVGLIVITVVNPGGATSNAVNLAFNIPALTIAASSLPAGTVGTAYLQTLSAAGGLPPYSNWVVSSGALPPGLTLDGNAGTISGTPITATGSPFAFSVIMKDSLGNVAPAGSFSIAINQPAALTIINASPLPAGDVGIPYPQTSIVATSGTPPYSLWSVTAGSLPPGFSLINLGFCTDPLIGTQPASGCIVWGSLSGTPTAAGTFTFTVQVSDSASATASKQFSLTINPAGTVSITPGGIVNAASYAGGGVSPGEIVTIFGSGLGPVALSGLQLSGGSVATTLASAQVLFDGYPAPLVYVQANQASVIVPYEIAGEISTKVEVFYQGQNSATMTLPVVAAAPGIFTLDYSGGGAGTVLNHDGTVNSANNPAAAGSLVAVYATGEGQTSPAGVDGQLDGSTVPQPVQTVTATIGGVNATVQSAGGITGAPAGLLEVVLQVPPTLATNTTVPVVLNVGGAASQAGVTISVQGAAQTTSSDRLKQRRAQ